MLRFLTAGESHGPCLTAILEGMPSGITIDIERIQRDLKRRQHGYGRGLRMQIEQDQVEFLGGVRHGVTLGSPIALRIENKDWQNWAKELASAPIPGFVSRRAISRPRPGHADLAGTAKYGHTDIRNVLERASARETAARVAVGGILKCFLDSFNVRLVSHTIRIGSVTVDPGFLMEPKPEEIAKVDQSPLRCLDPEAEGEMIKLIDQAKEQGDTLGGVFETIAFQVPMGLGAHTHWDTKLDGRLAQAFMSIHAVKGVELGDGVRCASLFGSEVHDPINYDAKRKSYFRPSNRAGGLEGGITNGMPLRARGYMKPISTLRKPMMSVDMKTHEPFKAVYERSDTCVVPAGGVIGEAMMAMVLSSAILEKFGGDSLRDCLANFKSYQRRLRKL